MHTKDCPMHKGMRMKILNELASRSDVFAFSPPFLICLRSSIHFDFSLHIFYRFLESFWIWLRWLLISKFVVRASHRALMHSISLHVSSASSWIWGIVAFVFWHGLFRERQSSSYCGLFDRILCQGAQFLYWVGSFTLFCGIINWNDL